MAKISKKIFSLVTLTVLLITLIPPKNVEAIGGYTLNSFKGMHDVVWSNLPYYDKENIEKKTVQYDLDGNKKKDNIYIEGSLTGCGTYTGTIIVNNKSKIRWHDDGDGMHVALFDLDRNDKYEEIGVFGEPHEACYYENEMLGVTPLKIFRYDGKSIKCIADFQLVLNPNRLSITEFYINNKGIVSCLVPSSTYNKKSYAETGIGHSIRKFYQLDNKNITLKELKNNSGIK